MARGLPFTYGPSRTAPKSSTARAMGVLITAYYISITLLGHGAASGIKFDGGTRASDKLKLVAMILPHINTIGSTRI